MPKWKCAAEIWAVSGSDLERPTSILTEAGAEILETGSTLLVTYEASGSTDKAAELMSELFDRCYVMIEWGAVSAKKYAWASWAQGETWGPDSGELPKDKKEAWERVMSEVNNERVTGVLIGEEHAS